MRYFMLVAMFLFSSISLAQVDGDEHEVAKATMLNTGNQFIYSVFGKDLLIAYLNDEREIQAIKAMSDVEMDALTKPFNAGVSVFTKTVMAVGYILVVVYFLFKLSVVVLTEMWVFQSTGKMQSNRSDVKGVLLKVFFLGVVVVAPISILSNGVPYTNGLTYLVFDMLGRSHGLADDAVEDMVLAHRENLQAIRLPSAASKYPHAIELNRFMGCVANDRARRNDYQYVEEMTLYKVTETTARGQVNVGDCWLEVTVGIDNESSEIIRRLNIMDPTLSLDPNVFTVGQKQGVINGLSEMFNVSSKGAEVLGAKPKSEELDQTDGIFDQYTSRMLSANELKVWSERCDAVLSEPFSQSSIYEQDRQIYNQLVARCASAKLTKKLVYPDTIHAMDNILANEHFNQKVFPLCYTKAQVAQLTQGSGGGFTPRYVIDNGSSLDDGFDTISLQSCLSQVCSDDAMANGSMYACTQALNLYEGRQRDMSLAQKGLFSMGFHMMTLFIDSGPSMAAKRVYNSISVRFTDVSLTPIDSVEEYVTVPFIIPKKSGLPEYAYAVDDSLSSPYDFSVLPSVDVPPPDANVMEFMGATRLIACARSPLQLEGRYACGSIPQEFSRFGMALIHNVVLLKTALVVGDSIRAVRSVSGRSQGTGTMSNARTTLPTSSLASIGTAVSSAFGGTFDVPAVLEVIGLQQTVTDEFGEVSTEAVDSMINAGGVIGTLLLASSGAEKYQLMKAAVSMLDTGLMIGLLFGIIFGFLIALYPAFLLVKAIVKFINLLFKTIFIDAFRLIDSIFDDDVDLLNDAFNRVLNDFIGLVIMFPLTIAGVWLAWLMSNIMVAHVLNNITLTFATNDGSQGFLDVVVTMLFTFVIVIVVYNMIMSIIESFYQVAVEWLQGMMSNDPFTASRLDVQEARSFLRMIGR